MNIRHAILTVTLALAASTAQAKQPLITFARSDKTVLVYLAMGKGQPVQSVVLRAYGRVWTKSTNQIALEGQPKIIVWSIDVPAVRVPTVFRITPVKDAKRTLGELVAYPDRAVKWDKKTVLYATGPPYWLQQWADTIDLPVTYILPGRLDKWRKPKDKDKKQVLIIGREVADNKFADTLAIAKKHKINVLVLEAAWFGGKSGKVAVQPEQMGIGLAELRKQKWSMPPVFRSHRKPWPGIANRWAWMSDKEGLPMIEEIGGPTTSYRRIVLSYIPWQEQLGRREVADLTLLNVLSSAAKKVGVSRWLYPMVLYPSPKVFKDLTEAQKQRPVLAAALRAALWIDSTDHPPAAYIIDLRGKESPPTEFRKTLKWLENRGDSEAPLLILGDDPLLDDWKWAGTNRKKKKFKRGGIVWLTDDTLPPSAKNQIRLMLKLTELGIPMRHPKHLKKGKKDEKPNK